LHDDFSASRFFSSSAICGYFTIDRRAFGNFCGRSIGNSLRLRLCFFFGLGLFCF